MAEATVSISETALRKLQEIAGWSGLPMEEALQRANSDYHDRQFWVAVNAGYAALRADSKAWSEVEPERKAWDATLMDGLDPTERWSEDGMPLPPAGEGSSP
jgi:hypothetical protein